MTLEAHVLREDAVRAMPGGYEVDVHLAWYRSLPLSCVEDLSVTIDGDAVPRDDLRVRVGDVDRSLDELADLVDDWWFVQDAVTVLAPRDDPRPAGDTVEVAVGLSTRIPYIIIGPQTALVQRTEVAKAVTVR